MQTDTNQVIDNRYEIRGPSETRNGVELCEAYDRQLDRLVLLQQLTPEAAADADRSRRFLRSQQLAASVRDCPILSVYDAGIHDGRPFSVMERRKEGSPASLYRAGYPPDVPAALRVTRQAAEALRCCRDAGLNDWQFSPDAVCVGRDGNAQLAVIEGLEGPYASAQPSTDARALGAVLALALTGTPDAPNTQAGLALLPPAAGDLLGRMSTRRGDALWTAGDVEQAISGIERATYQPTQAYVSVPAGTAGSRYIAPPKKTIAAHEAPTLAARLAPVPQARPSAEGMPTVGGTDPATQSLGFVPYDTPPDGAARTLAPPARLDRRLIGLAGMVALLLLLALVVPKMLERGAANPARAADAQPGAVPGAMVAAPVLVGKTLDEARDAAGAAGVNLAVDDPMHDPVVPPDRVAEQIPGPSGQVQAGSLMTVSLSLGPEEPASAPAQAQPAPPAQQQTNPPGTTPPGKGKNNGKKGKDH